MTTLAGVLGFPVAVVLAWAKLPVRLETRKAAREGPVVNIARRKAEVANLYYELLAELARVAGHAHGSNRTRLATSLEPRRPPRATYGTSETS
jgi:hypothetical protein